MKDKQIKYLLTLKRKFESIRHDQYSFSKKNPLQSIPTDNNQYHYYLSKLYQMINSNLQSIEFKILETVNDSYKKQRKDITQNISIESMKNSSSSSSSLEESMNDSFALKSNTKLTNMANIKVQERKSQQHCISKNKENSQPRSPQRISLKNRHKREQDELKQRIASPPLKQPIKQEQDNSQQHEDQQRYQQEYQVSGWNMERMSGQKSRGNSGYREQESVEKRKNMRQQIQSQKVNQFELLNDQNNQSSANQVSYAEFPSQIKNRNTLYSPQLYQYRQFNCNFVEIKQLFTDQQVGDESTKAPDLHSHKLQTNILSSPYKQQRISNQDRQEQYNPTMQVESHVDYYPKPVQEVEIEQLQTQQPNIDCYFNFETPKKSNMDLYDDNDMYERCFRQNAFAIETSSVRTIQKKIKKDIIQEEQILLKNDDKDDNDDKDIQEYIFDNVQPAQNQNANYFLDKTTLNLSDTVRKKPSYTDIHTSDQTTKYRFSLVTTEKKQEITRSSQQNSQETLTKLSNTSSTSKLTTQLITKTPNKKIVKKLEFKKDEDYRQYIRGPYNFYSEELKMKAIKDFHKYKDLKMAADMNEVKVKNLKRWIAVGHKRKEGGGRKKEDPDMEEKVYQWLVDEFDKNKKPVTRNQIRQKALELSNKKDRFKASKGWLEKFFFRYNCKYMSKKDNQSNKKKIEELQDNKKDGENDDNDDDDDYEEEEEVEEEEEQEKQSHSMKKQLNCH